MNDQSDDTIDIRGILAILKRQYRLIGLTVVCTLGLAIAYLFQATPMYRATAMVVVDPSSKNILEADDLRTLSSNSENAKLESELLILKSPKVILSTIDAAGLVSDPEFGPTVGFFDKLKIAIGIDVGADDDPEALLAATMAHLSSAVTATRRAATYIIEVAVLSESPERAARVTNALVKTYIDLQVKSKVELALGSRDLLQGQLDAAQKSLAATEQNLDQFIARNIDQIAQETGDVEIAQLNQKVTALAERSVNGEKIQASLDAALQSKDWQSLSQSLQNDALIALKDQREKIAEQLALTAVDSAEASDLAAQLQKIDTDLDKEAQTAIAGLRTEMTSLGGQINDLRKDLRTRVLSAQLSATTLTALYSLQQEADIAQRQYSTLLTRLRDLEAQAVVQLADSRLVSEALPPRAAVSPRRNLVLALALMVGLGAGLGLAFLNEYYVGGVVSDSQLSNLLPVPVGGIIPRTEPKRDQASISDNIVEEPLSIFAEAFRKLRATIDQASRNAGRDQTACKVIMVTSAIPGEGKTSIAMSLARTYAMSGKRTMLIDADLRKPSIHKHLNILPRGGFLEYLSGEIALAADSEFFVRDNLTKASILVGGGRPTQATDQLLQSDAFVRLITQARERLDIVIVDTSPLVPVVDARYIAPLVDTAILVVRFSSTTQSDLRHAYGQLADSLPQEANVFSVLSIDEARAGNYRYDGYYNSYTTG